MTYSYLVHFKELSGISGISGSCAAVTPNRSTRGEVYELWNWPAREWCGAEVTKVTKNPEMGTARVCELLN